MDRDATLHEVETWPGGHRGFAAHYIANKGIKIADVTSLYDLMEKWGWIRVFNNSDTINFSYRRNQRPSEKQMGKLRDLALVLEKDLYDDVKDKYVDMLEEDQWPVQTHSEFDHFWTSEGSSKLKDLLTEVHLQDLYHATNHGVLINILKDNAVKLAFAGGTDSDQRLNRGKQYFLSTMRQKYGNYAQRSNDFYDVIVHINGRAATAAGFKVYPVNYWGAIGVDSEQEERIVGDKDELTPLNKFVIDIYVLIDIKVKHSFTLERYHQLFELAKKANVPIYFYTDVPAFRSQRKEKSVKDPELLVGQPEWSKDDLAHKAWAATRDPEDRRSSKILKSFLKIYHEQPIDREKYPDKNVMNWILYYPHDAYSQIATEIHNLKKDHPPIFREIVDIMKKHGFTTVRELVKFVIDREDKKYRSKKT
jgi:hypothetical protein